MTMMLEMAFVTLMSGVCKRRRHVPDDHVADETREYKDREVRHEVWRRDSTQTQQSETADSGHHERAEQRGFLLFDDGCGRRFSFRWRR